MLSFSQVCQSRPTSPSSLATRTSSFDLHRLLTHSHASASPSFFDVARCSAASTSQAGAVIPLQQLWAHHVALWYPMMNGYLAQYYTLFNNDNETASKLLDSSTHRPLQMSGHRWFYKCQNSCCKEHRWRLGNFKAVFKCQGWGTIGICGGCTVDVGNGLKATVLILLDTCLSHILHSNIFQGVLPNTPMNC